MTSPKNFQSKKAVSAVPGMRPKTSNNKSKNLLADPTLIMLKKFRDDSQKSKKTYVPKNTLLDPDNVVPSWESGNIEIKEISVRMREQRQEFDKIHGKVLQADQELRILQQQLEASKNEEYFYEEDNFRKTLGQTNVQSDFDRIDEQSGHAQLTQLQYKHMIQRMKKDLIATQIQANELMEANHQKQLVMEEETEKHRQALQRRLQAQHRCEELMIMIEDEHQKRTERVQTLQNSAKNKQQAIDRRLQRVARQQEISEKAAQDNKDSNELKMQENFLAQKFWSAFLKSKMEKAMKSNFEIENAFQKIRAATGINDVQEIVQKFLTREQTYSQLLSSVSMQEEKIDHLRNDNEGLREKLAELQMVSAQEISNGGVKQSKSANPDLVQLDNKIVGTTRTANQISGLHKKVSLTNDQVMSWSNRIIQKIDQQFNQNIGAYTDKSMAFKFEKIMQAVCKQLEQIIMEEDDEDRGFITAKDFMNDFATDDFLSKNIRVRPQSGVNRDGDDAKTQGGDHSKLGDDENMDKFDANIKLDIQGDRQKIKERRNEFINRKREEEDKVKKKKY